MNLLQGSVTLNAGAKGDKGDDGINYCLANGLDSYQILFPDFVDVSLDGVEDEPPTDEPPTDEEEPVDEEPVDEEPPPTDEELSYSII